MDFDTLKDVFSTMGYEINTILKDSHIIEDMVVSKKIDAGFQFQKTKERERKYLFSNLFRNAVTEFITSYDDISITSISNIMSNNLSIGVIEGYSYGYDIDSIDSQYKISYKDHILLLEAISKKAVHIGIFDKGVKEYISEQNNIHNIYSIEPSVVYKTIIFNISL